MFGIGKVGLALVGIGDLPIDAKGKTKVAFISEELLLELFKADFSSFSLTFSNNFSSLSLAFSCSFISVNLSIYNPCILENIIKVVKTK